MDLRTKGNGEPERLPTNYLLLLTRRRPFGAITFGILLLLLSAAAGWWVWTL